MNAIQPSVLERIALRTRQEGECIVWTGAPASAATPRQQTRVAQRLVATFGGYSSWPACHRRLGLG